MLGRLVAGCVSSALFACAWAPAGAGAAPVETTAFSHAYDAFNPWISRCGQTGGIVGREPAVRDAGLPVFVYLTSTGGMYDGGEAKVFVEEMAQRGFVAASVQYESLFGVIPEALDGKSACVFGSRPTSAITLLCARPSADCRKGIVVAGFSQGAYLAARAHNHDARVRGVYALGFNDGVMAEDHTALLRPPPDGTRSLPGDRLRIVNGQGWSESLGEQQAVRAQLNALTGSGCDVSADDCLGASGAGWYVVQHAQVADGQADHCYLHGGGGCSWTPDFDPAWIPPAAEPWSLGPSLDWLAAQAAEPAIPAAPVNGLTGAYFDDAGLTQRVLKRVDPTIDFDWGLGSPDGLIEPDSFSVRWRGTIEVPASGIYTFHTVGDDGVRLRVGGRRLIDDWTEHVQLERSGSIALAAGVRHPIRLTYFDGSLAATARLLWSSPAIPRQVVPSTALFPQGMTVSAPLARAAASRIVVHARYRSFSRATRTITYTSRKGRYAATWIGTRRYRLRGTILGRRLKGTIRTRQAGGGRYRAHGSGRLGGRRVRISGGGPNSLRTATLILH